MKILRQVWQTVLHNKLCSAIYIFGTALAIATVTVYAVTLWAKVAPVYPEYKRSNTAYIDKVQITSKNGNGFYQSTLGYDAVSGIFSNLENATTTSAFLDKWENHFVQPEIERGNFKIKLKATDPAFFEIYTLKFLSGKPFDSAEFGSGLPVAVITDRTAREAFGPVPFDELTGKDISIDNTKYRICGIVREGSPSEQTSYGQAFIPYTSVPDYDSPGPRPLVGNYTMILLTDDFSALKAEVRDIVNRYNNSQDQYICDLISCPVDHYTARLNTNYIDDFSIWSFLASLGGVLAVLLLVPALNLSGMISGQMENRLAEMGVRKSFGATRRPLLGLVLAENLVLTLAGGIIGYAFAWILFNLGVADIITEVEYGQETVFTAETVFSPIIFAFTFAVCCLLNVFSAFIPAYRSLGAPIVKSLKN